MAKLIISPAAGKYLKKIKDKNLKGLFKDAIDDIVGYLKDNLDVYLQMYQGNVINVILPSTITYKIVSTVPGVK